MRRKASLARRDHSGEGGLGLGFALAGFTSAWAVEIDSDAAATYETNFRHAFYAGPIQSVVDVPMETDVIVGGPPCQGFSPLGKMSPRNERAEMNQLWRQYMRIVDIVQPKVFVVENVPEFLRSAEGARIIAMAEERGYHVTGEVLNAYDYGVPQKRKRAIIICSRVGIRQLPAPNGLRRTVRNAIGDLPLVPTEENWHIARNPRNPRPECVLRYRLIPPGGNRFDLLKTEEELRLAPQYWIANQTGSTDVFGRLVCLVSELTRHLSQERQG